MGPDQQGLGIAVADAADAAVSVKLRQVLFKLGAEGGVFNGVDLPLETVFWVVDDHAAPAGPQMGVVVHAEEDIQSDVLPGDCAKKTAHQRASVMRRMTSA